VAPDRDYGAVDDEKVYEKRQKSDSKYLNKPKGKLLLHFGFKNEEID
jgi:hypothetical protein